MTTDEIAAISAIANSISSLGILTVVIFGLLRGVVVTRGHLQDVEKEKNRQIAILQEWIKDLRDGEAIPES